jgi:hypothetical protein
MKSQRNFSPNFAEIGGDWGSKREDWDGSMQVSGVKSGCALARAVLCSGVWQDALTFRFSVKCFVVLGEFGMLAFR